MPRLSRKLIVSKQKAAFGINKRLKCKKSFLYATSHTSKGINNSQVLIIKFTLITDHRFV